MVGGFYQYNDLESAEHVVVFGNALPQGIFDIRTRSLSAFAQADYDFGNGLNASVGIRYTDDKKTQKVNLSPKFLPELRSDNWSPEITLSYQPTNELNIYASYKEGYKSGSFQVASIPFGGQIANPAVAVVDNSYLPETVSGFEAGVKAELFDRQLRVDLTAYTYKYNDLQLSQLDPATAVNRINNASGARIKGIEFSANYSPFEIPGLRLFATVAFNDAKYSDFIAGCYTGQTLAQGCTIDGPDANTVPDQQSLAGKPMMKAPKWTLSTGMSLSTGIGSGMKLGFDPRFVYETKSFLSQDNIPWGMRPSGGMLDATLTLGAEDGGWEIGLVGKNLTNKLYPGHLIQAFGSGSGATTGTTVGSPADLIVYGQRGREIRVRGTVRF